MTDINSVRLWQKLEDNCPDTESVNTSLDEDFQRFLTDLSKGRETGDDNNEELSIFAELSQQFKNATNVEKSSDKCPPHTQQQKKRKMAATSINSDIVQLATVENQIKMVNKKISTSNYIKKLKKNTETSVLVPEQLSFEPNNIHDLTVKTKRGRGRPKKPISSIKCQLPKKQKKQRTSCISKTAEDDDDNPDTYSVVVEIDPNNQIHFAPKYTNQKAHMGVLPLELISKSVLMERHKKIVVANNNSIFVDPVDMTFKTCQEAVAATTQNEIPKSSIANLNMPTIDYLPDKSYEFFIENVFDFEDVPNFSNLDVSKYLNDLSISTDSRESTAAIMTTTTETQRQLDIPCGTNSKDISAQSKTVSINPSSTWFRHEEETVTTTITTPTTSTPITAIALEITQNTIDINDKECYNKVENQQQQPQQHNSFVDSCYTSSIATDSKSESTVLHSLQIKSETYCSESNINSISSCSCTDDNLVNPKDSFDNLPSLVWNERTPSLESLFNDNYSFKSIKSNSDNYDTNDDDDDDDKQLELRKIDDNTQRKVNNSIDLPDAADVRITITKKEYNSSDYFPDELFDFKPQCQVFFVRCLDKKEEECQAENTRMTRSKTTAALKKQKEEEENKKIKMELQCRNTDEHVSSSKHCKTNNLKSATAIKRRAVENTFNKVYNLRSSKRLKKTT